MNQLTELTRRRFLGNVYSGLGGVGLMHLLGRAAAAEQPAWEAGRGQTHHAPRAKRVLQIFCPGAASAMDLWEHKPSLEKYHGKPLPGEENFVSFQGKNGNLMKSPWEFAPAGESGKLITSMLPQMARHVDDIAFLHAMVFPVRARGPAMRSAVRTRICRLMWQLPMFEVSRRMARRTGPTDSCPLGIRPS